MPDILINIRQELTQQADEKTRSGGQRFFKENITLYGVKTGIVSKIAREYLPQIRSLSKKEVFDLCDELFKADFCEEAYIAAAWVYSRRIEYLPEDFKIFEKWIAVYINNWAKCDTLCNHALAALIDMYPQLLAKLNEWAKSDNRWVKRASAVSLIIPAKEGRYLADILEIADILLRDNDDMVQKGYGWMLKAASQSHRKEIFEYVLRHKDEMPRTALRYAIEKMPVDLKKIAMQKG